MLHILLIGLICPSMGESRVRLPDIVPAKMANIPRLLWTNESFASSGNQAFRDTLMEKTVSLRPSGKSFSDFFFRFSDFLRILLPKSKIQNWMECRF